MVKFSSFLLFSPWRALLYSLNAEQITFYFVISLRFLLCRSFILFFFLLLLLNFELFFRSLQFGIFVGGWSGYCCCYYYYLLHKTHVLYLLLMFTLSTHSTQHIVVLYDWARVDQKQINLFVTLNDTFFLHLLTFLMSLRLHRHFGV